MTQDEIKNLRAAILHLRELNIAKQREAIDDLEIVLAAASAYINIVEADAAGWTPIEKAVWEKNYQKDYLLACYDPTAEGQCVDVGYWDHLDSPVPNCWFSHGEPIGITVTHLREILALPNIEKPDPTP